MAATMIEHRASTAMLAWREGQRRRRAAGAVDRAADAALAVGGVVLANAATPLGLGLPTGRMGFSIGAGLIYAGAAWIARHRRSRIAAPQHAVIAQAQRPAWYRDRRVA